MSNYNVQLLLEMEHWTNLWQYEIEKLKEDPEKGYDLLHSARYELMCHPFGTTIRLNEHVFMSVDDARVGLRLTLSGPIPKGPYNFTTVTSKQKVSDEIKPDIKHSTVTQKSGYEFL